MSEFETPYSRAWDRFAASVECNNLVQTSRLPNETDSTYAINRIRRAFDAGWNSKTSSILDALKQMSDRGGETK